MTDIRYLTLDEVVALHAAILEMTGSPVSPLLRRGDPESVLARPRHAAWSEGADLIRQAILLGIGISQSQAFLDGNKRAGFAAADVLLRINGLVFDGDPMQRARWFEAVAASPRESREAKSAELEAWLRPFVSLLTA